jgi:predicted nucleic acid-binding protein
VVVTSGPVPSPRPGSDDGPDRLPRPRAAADDVPGPVVGPPRTAPDDAPARQATKRPVTRVYADGSALAQYIAGAPYGSQWWAWARDHEAELITTPLGLAELRRSALSGGVEARGVAHDVEDRIEVVRFSDQTLRAATKVSGVLPPFIALHIGAALAHPGVSAVATYEVQLARVAALHGLAIVSPGPAGWWWESDEGP